MCSDACRCVLCHGSPEEATELAGWVGCCLRQSSGSSVKKKCKGGAGIPEVKPETFAPTWQPPRNVLTECTGEDGVVGGESSDNWKVNIFLPGQRLNVRRSRKCAHKSRPDGVVFSCPLLGSINCRSELSAWDLKWRLMLPEPWIPSEEQLAEELSYSCVLYNTIVLNTKDHMYISQNRFLLCQCSLYLQSDTRNEH